MGQHEVASYSDHHGTRSVPHASLRTVPIALVLALVGMLLGALPAGARPVARPSVVLTFDQDGMTLDRDVVRAGPVTFTLRAPDLDSGAAIMFRLRGSSTLEDLRLAWPNVMSGDRTVAAQATRDLSRHAVFVGLAEVARGRQVSVTQLLSQGVYYIQDSPDAAEGTRHTLRFRVSGPGDARAVLPHTSPATIAFTADNRFDVRGKLPAAGTVTLRNRTGSLQSLNVWPVQPGTTDAEVQAWLDSGAQGPGFFLDGPTTGFNVMSPGRTAQLEWDLPPGTYLLFDEVRDEHSGVSRLFEGMHQVVVLK